MADPILAIALLLGGLGWAFVCFMAGANHPTGETPMGGFIAGLLSALAGVAWLFWWLL